MQKIKLIAFIVIGGSGGIGLEVARRARSEGTKLILTSGSIAIVREARRSGLENFVLKESTR